MGAVHRLTTRIPAHRKGCLLLAVLDGPPELIADDPQAGTCRRSHCEESSLLRHPVPRSS
jgi:hypothetical protein